MELTGFILVLITLLAFLSIVTVSTSQQHCTNSGTAAAVRAGYWLPSTNHYFPFSSINTSLYTHLYYDSLSIDEIHSTVEPPPADELPVFAAFSTNIKSRDPSLKIVLCIATDEYKADVSNAAFSRMAADPDLRKVFIESSIELARANAFDGLDLAWRFPTTPMDMANLGVLLTEWRARIDEEAKNSSQPLLLTATLYFSNHLFDMTDSNLDYPIEAISYSLDWVNVLTFGFRKNSNITAADAPLYDKSSHFSSSYGIMSWLDAGIPPCKLVMGLPLYGKSWFLKNKEKNGLGAPTAAAGTKQKRSNQTGVVAYAEIEDFLKLPSSVLTYDSQSVCEIFCSGDLWVSFDSLQVVQKKIEFARKYWLLGYFLWPISFDDTSYTVSKQASETWLQYQDSSYVGDGSGTEQTAAPVQDLALDSSAASFIFRDSRNLSRFASLTLLLVLLFYQVCV